MATINNPVTVEAEPVMTPAQAAELAAWKAQEAEMEKRRKAEAILAAEQDAALDAVRAACDAEREALKQAGI